MTNIPLRVLIVEDSPDDATLLIRAVRKGGFELSFERVETADAMRSALADRPWDIILCDFRMPTFDGFSALAALKESNLDIPLILVSGAIGEDTAVEAMKAGASDYVMKSNLQRLIPAIERELKEAASRAEKRKAEEALRQNEDRFRHISSITTDIAYSCIKATNTDYSIDWMMGATERITGYSEDYIRTLGCWRSLVFDDDLPVFDSYLTSVTLGKTGSCELRLRHKNGNIVWVTFLAKCVLDPGFPDNPHLYAGFVDITERKQLEQRNLELAAIVESSDEAIVSSNNLNGIITSWNSGAERTYGYKEAEVVGKPVSIIIPKDRQHEILKFLEVIKSGANIQHYETVRLTKSGKEIPVTVSISATKNKQGRIIGASSIACDITDRKRIEEELWGYREHLEELVERRTAELLESFRRFRDLCETTSDVVWEVDARGLLTYVSPRIRDVLGYSPEDFLGKAFSDFMSREEADRFANFSRSICLSRKPFTCVETTIIHKDGQTVIFE
ncbi:MAG: PAS domain S-box protein, partial [Desulfomonilaceae bacterium]